MLTLLDTGSNSCDGSGEELCRSRACCILVNQIRRLLLLKTFDAARHAQQPRSAYRFIVWTKVAEMRLGIIWHRKRYDHERVGCMKGSMSGAKAMDSESSLFC